jgi:hypothetical protein
MSEIPETPTNAARALIGWFAGALAFEAVHAYAEGGSTLAALGYGIGAIIVVIGDYKLKALLAGSPRLTKSLNDVAADARWWVAVGLVSLLIIAVSSYIEQRVAPWLLAAFGALAIGIALFSALKRQAAPVASAPGGIDTQTRLDLVHLLDFALNQSALVLLGRLIELASSPEVTDAFKNGENSLEAQQSRHWYIGYVGQEIIGNFDRHQSYLGIRVNAEAEVDGRLDGIEDQRLPAESLVAFRRRLIDELTFQRAVQFLRHEKREVEDRIRGQRARLTERLHHRQDGSVGG